ncbi:MAG: ABC transporter permease [Bacteroidota bacterium]|nr:ABC transporter permease [Bacteroidota bacterium]
MNYKLFIAKRYLLAKKEAGFITIISLISIIGVAVGVAALIVVLSVFNGFNSLVTQILVSFDPHVRIEIQKNASSQDVTELKNYISQSHDVAGIGSFVSGKVMVVSKKLTKVIFLRGVESQSFAKVSGVKEKLIIGDANFSNAKANDLILGFNLADKMSVGVDDTVYLISSAGIQGSLVNLVAPPIYSYRISGVYESNNKDYDGLYGFTSLASGQKLFAMDSSIHGIDVRLTTIDNVESFASDLRQKFGEKFYIQTWFDLHKDLYSVMIVERWTAFIILALIIAVASFNLLGSLTMTVIEKTRDIGILKAMGAKNVDIQKIFRFEGMVVGVLGSSIGLLIGYIICLAQIKFQLFALDPTAYIIPALPIDMRLSDFIVVPLATIILCYIATIYPSKRASRLLPAEAIRWE